MNNRTKDILIYSFAAFCFFNCLAMFYTIGWFHGKEAAKKEFLKPSITITNDIDDTLKKLDEWDMERKTKKKINFGYEQLHCRS